MLTPELIKEIHENAVAHGWWEGERDIAEIYALIHSELSEALEEYRSGKEMIYYVDGKPEGIAVELMDGVIRILDLYGQNGITFTRSTVQQIARATKQANPLLNKQTPLVEIIAAAHSLTAKAGDLMLRGITPKVALGALEACAGLVMWWVDAHGENPEKILEEKHQYNLTRPYKHGKKF